MKSSKEDLRVSIEYLRKLMIESLNCLERFEIEYGFYGKNSNNKYIQSVRKRMNYRYFRRRNCYVINVKSFSKI